MISGNCGRCFRALLWHRPYRCQLWNARLCGNILRSHTLPSRLLMASFYKRIWKYFMQAEWRKRSSVFALETHRSGSGIRRGFCAHWGSSPIECSRWNRSYRPIARRSESISFQDPPIRSGVGPEWWWFCIFRQLVDGAHGAWPVGALVSGECGTFGITFSCYFPGASRLSSNAPKMIPFFPDNNWCRPYVGWLMPMTAKITKFCQSWRYRRRLVLFCAAHTPSFWYLSLRRIKKAGFSALRRVDGASGDAAKLPCARKHRWGCGFKMWRPERFASIVIGINSRHRGGVVSPLQFLHWSAKWHHPSNNILASNIPEIRNGNSLDS